MKSYEEMTYAVLHRAKEQRRRNQRRNAVCCLAACCVCCLALLAAIAPEKTETRSASPHSIVDPKIRIALLSNADDSRPKMMVQDVVEPYRYQIRVLSTEGLNDEQIADLIVQQKAYSQQLWTPENSNRMYTCYGGDTAIVSLMSAGRLMVIVDDYEMIKDYTVTTTETGYISSYAHLYRDDQEAAQGIGFGWTLSNSAIEKIMEDPTIKLSSLSDTITVCVEFKDGTTETVIADVVIQDDGQVFIVHRGAKAMA